MCMAAGRIFFYSHSKFNQLLGLFRHAQTGRRLLDSLADTVPQRGQQLSDPTPIARRLYRRPTDSSWLAKHGSPP